MELMCSANSGVFLFYIVGRNGHVDVVRVLLNHGANVNIGEKYGYTPLHVAVWIWHVEVVR
jgi:ankyrin repeat protein